MKLTAYYPRLNGLTRDELRYMPCVDPKEVYGEDGLLVNAPNQHMIVGVKLTLQV